MERCEICNGQLTWKHHHKSDNTGIDDGPPFPVRKKAAAKPAAEMADIRRRAWATRRAKYGEFGHR